MTYKTTPTATGRTCGSTMGSNYVDLWVKRKPTSTCTETNVRFSRAGHVTNEKPSIGAQRIGAGAQRVGAECVEQLGFPCWPSVWHCALPYQGDCFFGGVAVACVSRCGATEVGALRAYGCFPVASGCRRCRACATPLRAAPRAREDSRNVNTTRVSNPVLSGTGARRATAR